jgi:MSHA biogenesis protein MshE
VPLVMSALADAAKGITSLDEVFKVAEQVDESGDFEVNAAK